MVGGSTHYNPYLRAQFLVFTFDFDFDFDPDPDPEVDKKVVWWWVVGGSTHYRPYLMV